MRRGGGELLCADRTNSAPHIHSSSMKLTIRSKLVVGFMLVLLIGTVASVSSLLMLSRSLARLQTVIDREDVVAMKATKILFASGLAVALLLSSRIAQPIVSQINRAMTQVDDVTQQTASAAEELASTAEEMSAQAESLQQVVRFFTLSAA